MKKQFLLAVVMSGIFFSSCQKEINSPNNDIALSVNSSGRHNEGVPFKGEYETTSQLLQPPPILRQRITGIGEATHLGESTQVAFVTVNLTTPPPFHLSGTATFTAANGDEFYTEFTGTNTPNGDGTATGIINHTITGGTGRFENATGNFTGTVLVNPANSTNHVTYLGSISY